MLIKQKANNFGLPNMDIQTVKGTTKIELYNPTTRIKKVYRDENTFQSAMVAKYMRGLGQAGIRLDTYSWTNILGGLFLFRDQITEGTQYMPKGNKMVGNGSYLVTNAGNPPELGTFNEIESSASVSAITQVYDFATNQANGNINCVCLTSRTGGHIGYGNASGTKFPTLKSFYDGMGTQGVGSAHAMRNNYKYECTYDLPILTVKKTYIPITVGSIKAGLSDNITFDLTDYGMPDGQNIGYFCQDGQYLYFVDSNRANAGAGSTVTYYKLDLDTDTLSTGTFTNSSTATVTGWYGFSVAHGLAFISSNNGVQVFDLSTSVLVKSNIGGYGYPYAGGLIILNIGNYPYFYDTTNDTIYPTNGAFVLSYNTGYNQWYEATMDIIYNRQYNEGAPVTSNPLYLATINNLDSQVTKTAAQTMKVTYTLTEA